MSFTPMGLVCLFLTIRGNIMQTFIKERLVDIPPKDSDLKVGDTVWWRNDYGLVFKNKIIGFNYEDEYNKQYKCFVHLDTDAYWFPKNHKHLSKESLEEISQDIKLNNGLVAEFTGEDFGRRYEIKTETKTIKAVLVDGELYSTSFDFGEPICPLPEELQTK